ncbi:MAG: hypothetical protein VKJ24_13940 [Synechococcales bacterium]|nr:hypothetical protein [Synechococcales bacterium]
MPTVTLFSDVLPLRAIAFQLLFLLMAIAIEAAVLNVRLDLGRKTSMQYAATVNLFTTVLGWMVFFIAEPLIPEPARRLLIEYVFFGVRTIPIAVIIIGFIIFLLTFLLKWQGMEWLEMLLEKQPKVAENLEAPIKFRGRKRQTSDLFGKEVSRPLAVLWANAFSFAAISIIIAIRILVDQPLLVR